MKLKAILFLCCSFYVSHTFAQEYDKSIVAIEKIADSLYYNLDDNEADRELKLRDDVLAKYADTTSSNYKMSLAKKYASKALYLMDNNSFDSAIVYSKKSLKILDNIDKKNLYLKGHVYRFLYHQYAYSGDWTTALILTRETLQIFKDTLVDNHKLVADVEFDIGFVASQFGDYATEIKQYNIAKNKYVSFMGENNYDVALKYNHLATVYGNVGFYKKELESYKNAAKIWETIDYKDKSYLSVTYGSLVSWYLQHGDYKTAEQYLIKKENLIKKYQQNGNWYNETFKGRTQLSLWSSYAQLYRFKKDTSQALAYNDKILTYLKAFDFNEKSNNPNNNTLEEIHGWVGHTTIQALRFKASIIKGTSPEKAKQLYEEVLNIKEKNSGIVNVISDIMILSRYASEEKNYKKAHQLLNEALLFYEKRKDDYVLMQLYAEKAIIALKRDSVLAMHQKYKQVFKKLQKDTLIVTPINELNYEDCKPFSNKTFIRLVLKAAENYNEAYAKSKNETYLQTAHNLNKLVSEIFSNNYVFSEFNNQTYHTVTQINGQLLNTTLLLNNETIYDEILQKIEESNSKLSWKKFLNSTQRKHINIPDSILEKEDNLKAQVHFYKKSLFLSNEKDTEKIKLWKEKLFDLNKEQDDLNTWFQNNNASYFNQTQKEFSVLSLKQKLKENQKIIKYVFAKDNIYAFTITKQTTNLIYIGEKNILIKELKSFIKLLKETKDNSYKTAAASIYNQLLPERLLSRDETHELIFVLDDVLHYLPMEILINNEGEYLIENHSVSYAPSLLLWKEQLSVKKSTLNKLGIFAPTYKSEKENNPKRNKNAQLLGAGEEAIEIGDLFNADMFLGKQANKQQFIDTAKDYSILHLAMHSNINNTDSEFSNLNFYENDENEKLFISELYSMHLNADLAVLSACNTGIGNLKKGEGLVNVSRAFTYAGVPSTVTSLWKVPDKETSQIMISFYTHLKDGKPKNVALQQAKLDYLNFVEDDALKHPFYWAGFVISGDISPIETTINLWIYAVVFGLLFLVFIKRKQLVKLFK